MFPADWVLAMLLLTGPSPDVGNPMEMFKSLRAPMTVLALQLEILDPRENKHVLVRESEFAQDVVELRRRYVALRNAPMLKDATRFPERLWLNEQLVLNRAFLKSLEGFNRSGLVSYDEYAAACKDTNQLYQVWDCARDAQCTYYCVQVRRMASARLRALLGEENFQNAQLPPPIPLWRMTFFARPVVCMP